MYLLVLFFLATMLEMFPISSSAHIQLYRLWLQKCGIILSAATAQLYEDFAAFFVALILAFFFFKRWRIYILTLPRSLPYIAQMLVFGFIVEFITVCLYGLLLYITIPQYLMVYGFMITTIALASLYWLPEKSRHALLTMNNAVLLGFAQGCALIPGISRLALTFVVARWRGFSARNGFELAWLIVWPMQVVVGLLAIKKIFLHDPSNVLSYANGISIVISVVAAYLSLYVMAKLVQYNKIMYWALYTGLMSVLCLMIY